MTTLTAKLNISNIPTKASREVENTLHQPMPQGNQRLSRAFTVSGTWHSLSLSFSRYGSADEPG
jgi:hypothetical protein